MHATETGEALDARDRLVARARAFTGKQDPDHFYRIAIPEWVGVPGKSWCGVFALSCLVAEGLWPADAERWRGGSGFVLRGVADGLLRVTKFPLTGDIAVFGAPLWHHAIVRGEMSNGTVPTIDGNVTGPTGKGVWERTHPVTDATTFYSIAPLLVSRVGGRFPDR